MTSSDVPAPLLGEVLHHFFSMDREDHCGSVRILGDLLITNSLPLGLCNHADQHCKVLLSYADSLYFDLQYRRALHFYKVSLKVLATVNTGLECLPSEGEIKWKMYKCHNQLREKQEALDILSSIPLRQRDSKVAMALAKLYHHYKNDSRFAIICYKQALSMSPLALEAAVGLLTLGMSLPEVVLISRSRGVGEGQSCPFSMGTWLYSWLDVQACIARNEFSGAVSRLDALTQQGFRASADINCQLGRCLSKLGEADAAREKFAIAHTQDPYALTHMDTYCRLLNSKPQLEKLSANLLYASCKHTEPWVAKAWQLLKTDNFLSAPNGSKTNIFVQKATSIEPKNAEAVFLQGCLLKKKNDLNGAVRKFTETVHIDPTFFEAFEQIVRCYLNMRYNKEALNIVRTAAKQLSQSRKYFLEGLALSQQNPAKAKLALERSVKFDKTFDRAVIELTGLYAKEKNIVRAAEILTNHLKVFQSARLHTELASCLAKLARYPEAAEQYRHALRLDESCVQARQGLLKISRMQTDQENPFDSRVDLALNLDDEADNIGSDESVLDLTDPQYSEWPVEYER